MRVRLSRLGLLSLVAVVALSCSPSTEPVSPTATFTGQWQGHLWQGKASATLWHDTLFVFGVRPVTDGTGTYEEIVKIRVAIHGVGRYVLDSTAVELYEVVGGDVITGSYNGVGPSAGVLDVTTYSGPGGSVEGAVVFDARRARSASSSVLRFENGLFRASVYVSGS